MGDPITFDRDGKTYRVWGVTEKATSVQNASFEADGIIGDRVTNADGALEEWRGPHARIFEEEANKVLQKLASFKLTIWRAANILNSFPEPWQPSIASVRQLDNTYMEARIEATIEPGTAAARTSKLRDYVSNSSGQDNRLGGLAGLVNLDGIRAEVTYQRPLTAAEHRKAIEAGESPASLNGATTAQTDPVDPATLITLPKPGDEVSGIRLESGDLNTYTTAVAKAFDDADQPMLDLLGKDRDALKNKVEWLRQDPTRWHSLSQAEKDILIESMPDAIGSMNGLPAAVRDKANRIVLAQTKEEIQRRLNEIGDIEKPWSTEGPGAWQTYQDQVKERDALREKLQGIRNLEVWLNDNSKPPTFLLGFSGDGNGRAIVAVGNPDTANNVATYVPGTGARLANLTNDVTRADAMYADADGMDPNSKTSVVMWLDYDAPQSIVPDAMRGHYADQAAQPLRDFQNGLDTAHLNGPVPHKTVLGHSYGTTVIGHAANGAHLNADDLMLVASPGVGVDNAAQLDINRSDHVYATTADRDIIKLTPDPIHNTQPVNPDFGADVVYSDPGKGSRSDVHSEYWDPGNVSRHNMASVITGNTNLLVYPPPPSPPPTIPSPPTEPPPEPTPSTPDPEPGPSPTHR